MARILTPERPWHCARAISTMRCHFSSESLKALSAMWIWPLPNRGSQFFGSLTPSSLSSRAHSAVRQLALAGRDPDADRSGEAFQRVPWNAECLQAGITHSNRQPGIGGLPPVRGGIDMRYQPAEQLAARSSIVDVQHHVRAEVG